MMSYLFLNLVFIVVVAITVSLCVSFKKLPKRHIALVIGVLLVFTAVFDSLIVGLGIVAYDPAKILGLTIGAAPVEDFFYAILAGSLIPTIWVILGKYYDRKS